MPYDKFCNQMKKNSICQYKTQHVRNKWSTLEWPQHLSPPVLILEKICFKDEV